MVWWKVACVSHRLIHVTLWWRKRRDPICVTQEKRRLDQLVSLLSPPWRNAASITRRQCRSFQQLGQMPPRKSRCCQSRHKPCTVVCVRGATGQ